MCSLTFNFLFHRDALRQIAGFVHIATASNRYVISKQLEWYRRQDRVQERINVRDIDRIVGLLGDLAISFSRHCDYDALTNFDLFDVSIVLEYTASFGDKTTTGIWASTRAIGPCFISPAA